MLRPRVYRLACSPGVLGWVLCMVAGLGQIACESAPDAGSPEEELGGLVRVNDPEFERYQPYCRLRDERIQMGLNFARKRILMVGGVFCNEGDRAVDVVEVKVLFFNYDKPVSESIHLPIRPGPYSPPVEPLTERAFSFYVEEIPQGWMSSHAELELTGIRFLER